VERCVPNENHAFLEDFAALDDSPEVNHRVRRLTLGVLGVARNRNFRWASQRDYFCL
jgi:hypothetical protein